MGFDNLVPGVNISDYSKSPSQRGWGSPCSVRLATVQLAEARVSVDHRLAELVGLIMLANEADGYRYRRADTGAYNCRKIAGTSTWSWHAWALAIDQNWQSNPYSSRLITDMPEWLVRRWNRYGFAWGGHYRGKKDAMHVEFMGTPHQAQLALEMARRELGGKVAPPPPPAPPAPPAPHPHDGLLQKGDKGPEVGRLQERLRRIYPAYRHESPINRGVLLAVDNDFGPWTEAWVRIFQRRAGIQVDGIVGPVTRRKLGL